MWLAKRSSRRAQGPPSPEASADNLRKIQSEGWLAVRSIVVVVAVSAATMTITRAQTPATRLLQKADLAYAGAFRVPEGDEFKWSGTALTYWPEHNSLLIVDAGQRVAELSIPEPATGDLAALPRAVVKQPFTAILQGKLTTIDGDTKNGVKIGGILPVGDSLVVSAWSYYDAGPHPQTKTHFTTGQNFNDLGTVSGPFQVGTGFQQFDRSDRMRIGGFVSGYMATIPRQWQTALGGTHLTGQGGMISILIRTSAGPSATVFTPADLGKKDPTPGTIVLGYPIDTSNPRSGLNRPTLGVWGHDGGLYNGTQGFRGMVFPDGTRSVLFFGWGSEKFCYGSGTADQALHMKPVPNAPGVHYCYDPTPGKIGNKGTHAYPTASLVFAYDASDLVEVKRGKKRPWDIKPYATWTFTLPFQSNMVDGIERGVFEIAGAAYDPAGRIFVSAFRNDNNAPVIHVFSLPAR